MFDSIFPDIFETLGAKMPAPYNQPSVTEELPTLNWGGPGQVGGSTDIQTPDSMNDTAGNADAIAIDELGS